MFIKGLQNRYLLYKTPSWLSFWLSNVARNKSRRVFSSWLSRDSTSSMVTVESSFNPTGPSQSMPRFSIWKNVHII